MFEIFKKSTNAYKTIEDIDKYTVTPDKNISDIYNNNMDYFHNLAEENPTWIDKIFVEPLKMYFEGKLSDLGTWLKINMIDLASLITVCIIIYFSCKAMLYHKKNDFPIIFNTIMIFTIIRLFWRVVFKY